MNALTIKQRKFSGPQVLFTAIAAILFISCIYARFFGGYATYTIDIKRGLLSMFLLSFCLPFIHGLGGNKKQFLTATVFLFIAILGLYSLLFQFFDFLL
jgi:predicted membrane protein